MTRHLPRAAQEAPHGIKFEDLVGKTFGFFGVDGNHFKLGRVVWQAIEDEDDGYRSYLDSIKIQEKGDLIFRKKPLAKVRVENSAELAGFCLVDTRGGHVWLTVGTDHADDWYPCFIFRYEPKPPRGGKK